MRKKTKDSKRTVSYLRVSTIQQDTEKNKTGVRAFANAHDFGKVEFVEEKVSGHVPWKERKIKALIDGLKEGDKLIVPELSRLGRSTLEIMEMLSVAREKKVAIYDVKNGWELNNSLQSEVMAFCFSIAARIERDLLIQRTSEGRRAAMDRGVKFGRPPGKGKSKLDAYKEEIVALLKTGSRQVYIAKRYGATPATLGNWLKKNEIHVKEEFPEEQAKVQSNGVLPKRDIKRDIGGRENTVKNGRYSAMKERKTAMKSDKRSKIERG